MHPWSEESLYPEITRIVTEAPSLKRAIETIATLLSRHAGGALLLFERGARRAPLARPEVREFLASAPACKFLYSMPLIKRGQELGRLVAAFADPPLPVDSPRRLATHAAEQLTLLLHHHGGRSARLN
jgi:hypothetical protein